MKGLVLTIALLAGLQLHSQKDVYCNGLEKVNVKAFVVLNGNEQKNHISKNQLNEFDLYIGLSDTTFKVLGFFAVYDCHSGSFFDINERKYFGNRIKATDLFIKGVRVGDGLVLDCINVVKNGKQYLVSGKSFIIVD